jgi:hypothetical protein
LPFVGCQPRRSRIAGNREKSAVLRRSADQGLERVSFAGEMSRSEMGRHRIRLQPPGPEINSHKSYLRIHVGPLQRRPAVEKSKGLAQHSMGENESGR